jgi:multiple sugar transport system substrate-binding protein
MDDRKKHPELVGGSFRGEVDIMRFRILAFSLSLSLLIAGCGDEPFSDKTTLRFSFWGGFLELAAWKEMKKTFEEKHPDVHLKLEYSPGSDNPSNLVSRMLAGSAADVMMIDDDGLCFLASKGYLESLDNWIERDREELNLDEFLPTAMDSTLVKGTHYALPFEGFCQLVYIGLDLFKGAGIPLPEKDWTWDDFVDIAYKLTVDKDGDGRVDQFGALFYANTLDSLSVLASYGACWMNGEMTKIAIDSPEARQALDVYVDLLFRKKSMPTTGEQSLRDGTVMMLTGKVGMVMAPAYAMIAMKSIEGRQWDVFHMPSGSRGKATRVSWDGIGIYTEISEEKKRIAWDWIKHVLSSDSQQVIGRSAAAMPVRADDVCASFIDPKSPQHEERFLEAILEYAVLMPQMLATKRWRMEAESVLQVFASAELNQWGRAILRGETPEESNYAGNPINWMSPEKALFLCQERCQAIVDQFTERGY